MTMINWMRFFVIELEQLWVRAKEFEKRERKLKEKDPDEELYYNPLEIDVDIIDMHPDCSHPYDLAHKCNKCSWKKEDGPYCSTPGHNGFVEIPKELREKFPNICHPKEEYDKKQIFDIVPGGLVGCDCGKLSLQSKEEFQKILEQWKDLGKNETKGE